MCRDSDLTARITGLEVRLARRSAEVEMLKAAVAACQADARRTPSPPGTPQVGTSTRHWSGMPPAGCLQRICIWQSLCTLRDRWCS